MSNPDIFVNVLCTECGGTGKVKVTKLSALRKKAGLDQQQVADKIGLTRTSISNIERGVQAVSLDKVKPLADLYGVAEYELYDIAKQLSRIGNLKKEV